MEPQFHFQRNEHSPDFSSVFAQLWASETLVDVTLAADGRQLQAHRVVLSASSSYFQDLFVANPCRHPIVILKDVKFEDLQSVVRFIYHGEVKISKSQLDAVLKTADLLRVKGLSQVPDQGLANKITSFAQQEELARQSTDTSFDLSQGDTVSETSEIQPKKRKLGSTGISSESWDAAGSRSDSLANPDESVCAPANQESESRGKETVVEQISLDSDRGRLSRREDSEDSCTSQAKTSSASNGSTSAAVAKKRYRPLFRQQCVKNENEQTGNAEPGDTASPGAASPSPASSGAELSRSRSFLQVPTASSLPRQRSQPILPSQTSVVSGSSVVPISFLPANIPTVAVTPASTAPNIVIEQYPPILRVVSYEDMPSVHVPAGIVRASSSGSSVGSRTLQVPSLVEESSAGTGKNLLKARLEENLKRSVSNPGPSTTSSSGSSTSTSCSTNGHCPVLRSGAALGCNYCWNTVDDSGRTLRRKTKYYCPDCQTNLCIVPCFQRYHEKPPADDKTPSSKNSTNPNQQLLSKMSSI